ncbi:hypothetical protein BLNAU_16749 [Blattamonas nauphoetae]|uniref:Uncharacterized protein n=1 Tax=Blattamonas nauphoetae TaxID=2049346 RepID=A0ABQ9XAP5_9EUKA|nr:hypothetical protein BLNAU_16749 [Blattamonas nauphoetae]
MSCIGITRISLFPHLRIAVYSLKALYRVIQPNPPALTHLPSPIFPSSSPHQQYSGFPFLAALTKKLRIISVHIRSTSHLLLSRTVRIVTTAKRVERHPPAVRTCCTDDTDRHHTHPHIQHSFWQPKMSPADEERRDTIFLHVFLFLCAESQAQLLSSFNTFIRSQILDAHRSHDRIVEWLVEMTIANSVNTPVTLLTEMRNVAEFLFFINPTTHSIVATSSYVSPFEVSIVEKLKWA